MMLVYSYGWMTAVGLFFLLILTIILASSVVIQVHFRRLGSNDDAELNVRALYGIVRYRVKIPIIIFTGKSIQVKENVSTTRIGFDTSKQVNEEIDKDKVVSSIDRLKHMLQMTRNLTGWTRQTLRRFRLTEWNWSTSIGTDDAMWTAMTTGFIWTVKTTIVGILSQMVKLQTEPNMKVTPNYQEATFTTEWSCIAQIRFGYAILAGLQLLVRIKKVKGGVKAWQNILFKA